MAKSSDNNRKAAQAKVHLGKKTLGLDDDTYRALLKNLTGKTSSKDFSDGDFDSVIAYFRTAGVKFTTTKKGKAPHTLNTPTHKRADQLKKIEAMLTELELPWDYLTARQDGEDGKTTSMVHRLTGKQALEWCDGIELGKVIAALAIHQRRQAKKEVVP